ncbi:hypothetical protein KKG46_05500 [Patescibacteria group bacterium]|nr:hypothetical protein [Patescibacteria group bacterium]
MYHKRFLVIARESSGKVGFYITSDVELRGMHRFGRVIDHLELDPKEVRGDAIITALVAETAVEDFSDGKSFTCSLIKCLSAVFEAGKKYALEKDSEKGSES